MKIGAVLPQSDMSSQSLNDIRTFVDTTERMGFDHLLSFDHVLGADSGKRPDWDGPYDHTAPFLEPLTLFAYLGATTRMELCTDVLVLPQRQTALLAKQAATLDHLLEGRLRLGIGIGWNAVEYVGLGVEFGTRGARFEEQIGLLRRLWTEPTITHVGTFDQVDRAGIYPLPLQQPIPLWIGCTDAPAAIDRVGRLADGWMAYPGLSLGGPVEDALKGIRTAAERTGRDPDGIGLEGHVAWRPDGAEQMRDELGQWADLGATHVHVHTVRQGLEWPTAHLDAIREAADAWGMTEAS